MRKTKIICTMGPSVDDVNILEKLMLAGMDCARFNFSHGKHSDHLERMDRVKFLRKKLDLPVAIMLDIKGPEIRLKCFAKGYADVVKGGEFIFSPDSSTVGSELIVGLSYPDLANAVKIGTTILVDDGKVGFTVKDICDGSLVCEVLNDGRLSNHKSINIPGASIDMVYLNEVDKEDILFGIEQDVDFIAASFVRTADDVIRLRTFLDENGGKDIHIISKIENSQGIDNIDEILEISDGVMVARGDMGVEIPLDRLPAVQKNIIKKCYRAGKYVVTATQMLESMTKNPRPTRAEVSDVANAIYDGSTIIMLSGETAAGDYPVETVKVMADIAAATEANIHYEKRFYNSKLRLGSDIPNIIANSACSASYEINAAAILVATRTGRSADLIADYRPECPIIAAVIEEKSCRQLNLSWNVKPVFKPEMDNMEEIFEYGIKKSREMGIVKQGDTIIILSGSSVSDMITDMMRIHKI